MWHEIPRYDYAYDRKINELHSIFIMLLAIGMVQSHARAFAFGWRC